MNLTPGFAYIWEYRVKDDGISEFRRIYGLRGDWVELFSRSSGFVRTDLYQDVNNPNQFVGVQGARPPV